MHVKGNDIYGYGHGVKSDFTYHRGKDDEKLDFKQLTELSDKVMDKISDIKGIDTIGATAGGSSTMN